jgi:transcriptional regulator with XRE-family HTH domain
MEQEQIIGRNIKLYREKLGFKQDDLAGYLSISREEVSYLENARRPISTLVISKIANLFGIEEYDLYEEDLQSITINVALAFRADSLVINDIQHIADFRKIILNYLKMKKAILDEPLNS